MSEQESDIQSSAEEVDHSQIEGEVDQAEESISDLKAKLEKSEAQAKENWDLLLRSKAELDNVQKRSQRDLENAHKYAIEKIAQEMLAVIDSMELGLSAASEEGVSIQNIVEGSELTLKMMTQALEKFGVARVDPLNKTFNPELHQAMSMQETTEVAAGTVLTVMQKGYLLKDRLLRPALVVVAKAPSQTEEDSSASGEAEA